VKYLLHISRNFDKIKLAIYREGRGALIAKKKRQLRLKQDWCKGCGICVAFCPKQVLGLRHEKVMIVNPENCILCGQCEMRCPDYAIFLEEEAGGGLDG